MTWGEYEKELKKIEYGTKGLATIRAAFEFARTAHAKEKRLSGEDYVTHPIAVSLYIAQLKLDKDTVCAALLHDVVENQHILAKELKKKFGDEVAFLVEAVTKVDAVRYRGIEREVESIRKMFFAVAEDIRVVLIKLADRLHNMETLQFHTPEKQKIIATETLELYAPLADRLGMWDIKARLEDLAFPYLYPEEYQWLDERVRRLRADGTRFLEKLKPRLEYALRVEHIEPIRITYRTKHLYSIWKKLLKYEMDFGRVLDIVAMRITVKSVEDCYKTLGIIHKLWRPIPGRIKDFIALPKPNGYQSLHTTVFGPEKKIVDLQIRTEEMHREAEFGIAAHWAYKTGTDNEKKYEWVKSVHEWYQDHRDAPKKDVLAALKIDFFKDRIFVLTPKGDVIDLPEGSTPIDFAYRIHSDIGDHMFGSKVNGKMVPFSFSLKSGNTVEILTQKNKKPTADWLEHATTSQARSKIKSYLRKTGVPIRAAKKAQLSPTLYRATVTAENRVGLLTECSAVFEKFDINIQDFKLDLKNKTFPKLYFFFSKSAVRSPEKIMMALKKIKGVQDAVVQSYSK